MGHTRYNLFDQITKLCELQKTGDSEYSKMIQSGKLAKKHHDYGRGYYDVSIRYVYPYTSDMQLYSHACRVWFGTVDDGDFGSWNYFETEREARELVEKVAEMFKDMVVLPSHKNLNKLFRPLGVYFTFE